MRRYLLLLWLVLTFLSTNAQKLTVESFSAKTNDLSASTHERKDLNGNSCALVKVQLATSGAQFSPNVVGNVEYKVNEYWVYLPTMNKHMEVKHPSFLTKDVVFADYGVKLEPKTTYSLILTMPEGGTDTQVITAQYLLFNVEPADAIVEVNGEVWTNTDGVSRKFVPFGEYSYSVEASNYHTYSGTVTVNDPNNKTIVNVNLKPAFGSVKIPYSEALAGATVYIDNQKVGSVPYIGNTIQSGKHQVRLVKPMYKSLEQEIEVRDGETTEFSPALTANFSTVTLSVENGAQIYVNDELKGSGSWTGRLEYGECNIKTQKDGHRPQTKIYTISATQNNQMITLAPPTPIYGSVNIGVQPDESEVYIDGKQVGTTPLFLQKILVGKHKIEVKKSGYQAWTENIMVEENATYNVENKALIKGPANILSFTINGVTFDMIRVDRQYFGKSEVTIYYIGKYEVTQALWKAVMGYNLSRHQGDNLPVEYVSWNECLEFIKKLSHITGKNFRLPTSSEWSYAASGGNKSRDYKYSGSNNLKDVAWYKANSNETTHPVGTKQPNELGIYDMSGNVEEWCQDTHDISSYPNKDYRVCCGGSYRFGAEPRTFYYEDFGESTRHSDCCGLRLCLSE